jgi:SCY1-like protein 1
MAEIDESEGANAWGNDDLIDVNADEGDWGDFASGDASTTMNGGISGTKVVAPKPRLGSKQETPTLSVQGRSCCTYHSN